MNIDDVITLRCIYIANFLRSLRMLLICAWTHGENGT